MLVRPSQLTIGESLRDIEPVIASIKKYGWRPNNDTIYVKEGVVITGQRRVAALQALGRDNPIEVETILPPVVCPECGRLRFNCICQPEG